MLHRKERLKTLLTTLLIPLSGALAPAPSFATNEAILLDELDSLPIVLTPSRIAQPLNESPAAVTIIDRERIQESGVRNIAELFRWVPGMFVVYSSGQLPQVKYHGLDTTGNSNSRHLQVLIDGRSIYQSGFSRVLWSDIPLLIEDIERIEIVRSPSTVSHGTNAFLGVINIITRTPADSTQLLTLSGGSQKQREVAFRHAESLGDLDYRLSLNYREHGGFDHNLKGERDGQTPRLLNFRGDYSLSRSDQLQFDLGYTNSDKEAGTESSPNQSNWISSHQQLHWIHDLDINSQAQFSAYHQQRTITHQWDGGTKNRDWDEERFHLELQYNQTLSEQLRTVSGLNIRHDRVEAPTYFGDNRAYTKNSHQLYGNLEWHLHDPLLLHLGVMWDYEGSTGISELSPRAALNYHYNPNHSLRLSYSQAIRSPDLLEQHALWNDPDTAAYRFPATAIASSRLNEFNSGLISHTLKPEHITAYEIGWHFNLPQRRSSGDIKLYQEQLSDLTSTTLSDSAGNLLNSNLPYPFTHSNLNWARITGIELEAHWQPTAKDQFDLSYAHIFSYQSNSIDLSDSSPREIASLGYRHRFNQSRQVVLTLYHTSTLCGYLDYSSEPDGCSSADYTPSQQHLDLTLNQSLSPSTTLQLRLKQRLENETEYYNQNINNHSLDYRLTLSTEW